MRCEPGVVGFARREPSPDGERQGHEIVLRRPVGGARRLVADFAKGTAQENLALRAHIFQSRFTFSLLIAFTRPPGAGASIYFQICFDSKSIDFLHRMYL